MASYLRFIFERYTDSGKTKIWRVHGSDLSELGKVKWYGPWRKYVFVSKMGVELTMDVTCLREMAMFVEAMTEAHNM